MTIDETKKIVDKIRAFRPTFGGNFDKAGLDHLKLEWYRILESYDYEDVDKKLDEYFRDGDNFGRYPDAYYLIKYLKTHEEKSKIGVYYCHCHSCGELVDLQEYDEHYDRCNSITYLCKMSEKYYERKLSKEKLWELTDDEFNKKYWTFCEQLLNVIDDGLQKHCLKNAILTHYGYEPEYELEKIGEELKNEIE